MIWGRGILFILCLSYLFYETLFGAVILIPYLFFFVKGKEKEKKEALKWQMTLQFKDALADIAAALSAGFSLENSMTEALGDLRCVYPEESLIVTQFQGIVHALQMNRTIEDVFFELSRCCEIEEVDSFAWILVTAKRTGGNLVQIAKHSSSMISQKIEVAREIRTLLASKKLEGSIMNGIPLAIILYLKVCSAGFLSPLYGNLRGRVVMTIILAIYLATLQVAKQIMHIKV